ALGAAVAQQTRKLLPREVGEEALVLLLPVLDQGADEAGVEVIQYLRAALALQRPHQAALVIDARSAADSQRGVLHSQRIHGGAERLCLLQRQQRMHRIAGFEGEVAAQKCHVLSSGGLVARPLSLWPDAAPKFCAANS